MLKEKENSITSSRIFWSRPAAWLKVTGSDAPAFLQGQFTNDLRRLPAGPAVYGLWLDHKGHVQADSFVGSARPGEYWIASYFSPGEVLRSRLERYIIADDVVIEDVSADMKLVTLFDRDRAERARSEDSELVMFSGRRARDESWEIAFPASAESALRARFAELDELSPSEMEQLRIAAAIPAVPADIGPGELPNEGGLDEVGVAYAKGCYVGQEVMARLKNLGQVRRRLFRVEGSLPVPHVPAPLHQGGRKLGELRSAIADGDGFNGLALLSTLPLQRGMPLAISPGGSEITLVET